MSVSAPWSAERLAARLPFLRRRALLTAATRSFFTARGFMEVETPIAVPCPGEDEHIETFRTERRDPQGGRQPLWLHTSPEFAMKKLLAAGSGPIFQLARVFRNAEGSDTHAHEFTMLEWYSPNAGLDALIAQTHSLLRAVLPPSFTRGGRTLDTTRFERLSVAEAFARYCGADLLAAGDDAAALARACGTSLRPGEGWEDLFFRMLLTHVEPQLGQSCPTFLTHWPQAQAALARRDPDDPRVALRFELFFGGMELANAFEELTDPQEQRQRFLAWRARRHARQGEEDWALDEGFLAALGGMPAASGIALGFDRLAMLASGAARIEDVLWLPA